MRRSSWLRCPAIAVVIAPALLGCGDRRPSLTGPAPLLAPGSIVVHVRDAVTGAPIYGAGVVLVPPQGDVVIARRAAGALTDADGIARLPAVDAARYRLLVLRIGYQRALRPIDIRPANGSLAPEMSIALTLAPEHPEIDVIHRERPAPSSPSTRSP